jgi:N-acetylglucosaminyl-diphospho-decaprenol L-rhamnosyltransferase
MSRQIGAIIVSHDSVGVLSRCLQHLSMQTVPCRVIIVVDSGSSSTDYLDALRQNFSFTLIKSGNIGFSRANNLGVRHLPAEIEMVVFLNPDTFLPLDYLDKAVACLENHPRAAVISGRLEGYDAAAARPTGRIDSTGVFRSWYGRWYDRDQGREIGHVQRTKGYIPAACGALLCCRRASLQVFADHVFDPDFFLYKEDIELCLRLRNNGWKILFDPELTAYHCRGWGKKRMAIPHELRKIAAESEVLLYKKHPSIYMLWALMKYILVRWGLL